MKNNPKTTKLPALSGLYCSWGLCFTLMLALTIVLEIFQVVKIMFVTIGHNLYEE